MAIASSEAVDPQWKGLYKAGGISWLIVGLLYLVETVDLIAAAKANDQSRFALEDQKWTKNAEDIATFLSGANNNWTKTDLVDLLGQHLSLTKAEAVARLTKDWEADVRAFDDIFTEILTVADALSDGIIKQFPNKFRK